MIKVVAFFHSSEIMNVHWGTEAGVFHLPKDVILYPTARGLLCMMCDVLSYVLVMIYANM